MPPSKVRVGRQRAKSQIATALVDRFTRDILKLIESGALEGSFADFVRLSGKSLESRTARYLQWRSNRIEHGVWTFSTELQGSPGLETCRRVTDQRRYL